MFDAPADLNESKNAVPSPDTDLQNFSKIRSYIRSGKMHWARITARRHIRLINEDLVSRKEAGEHNGKAFPLHENRFLQKAEFNRLIYTRFQNDIKDEAILGLERQSPSDSAHRVLSLIQIIITVSMVGFTAAAIYFFPLETAIFLNAIITVYFLASIIFRVYLLGISDNIDRELSAEAPMEPFDLPVITVLLPLYKDAQTLPLLIKEISALDYPTQLLDVKLLLEADDDATIIAAESISKPSFIETIVIPSSSPRTKPKACNYGLHLARGELIVIYDAEDQPERDQLLKAARMFHESEDTKLACVQARLNYYNSKDNWLTRLFTLEYSLWFDWLLPALQKINAPIPLGGTSNFFKTDILCELGGWDPFNVTEDADLGLRLSKHGYRTKILNSTTFEEANCDHKNWIRQRSRWMKGYLQTWLVHMRQPRKILKTTGWVGLISVQLFLVGSVISALVNPILWVMFLCWIFFQPQIISDIFPAPLLQFNWFALVFGNIFFIAILVLAPLRRGWWQLCLFGLTAPFYWLLTSVAGYLAAWQLVTKPHYWEKTHHMISKTAQKRRDEALRNAR